MSTSVDPEKLNYIGLINESVHISDDKDIGDVFAINKYFLVVKRGYVRVHYYYIPLKKVEGWDGYVIWLLITEDEAKKYERDTFPHPFRYYLKDYPYERLLQLYRLLIKFQQDLGLLQKNMELTMRKK